jgi:hypothetical protein
MLLGARCAFVVPDYRVAMCQAGADVADDSRPIGEQQNDEPAVWVERGVGHGGRSAVCVVCRILVTDASLPLLNVVAGVVYALAMPFVALATSYVYFDARVRSELEPERERHELPAGVELAS